VISFYESYGRLLLTDSLTHRALRTAALGLVVLVTLAACGRERGAAVDLDALLGPSRGATDEPVDIEFASDAQATATPHLTPTPETDENCVACHSNQEVLQSLATESDAEESLSSGEG
jgi:hypothetical protein